MNEAVLRAVDISARYGRIVALRRLSLSVSRAGLVLVLGPNGAGKTTLMKALCGAIGVETGSVLLDGTDVTHLPAHRRVRRGIALVPEGRGTLPGLSVLDNLELGWHASSDYRRRSHDTDLDEIYGLFPQLRQRLDQDCSTLSGGEMQMLAIARALLSRPRVLLLDEPSLGLAPQATERIYETLHRLNSGGLAMVLVEQKAVPLQRTPETTIVLRSGEVVHQLHDARPTESELAQLYLGDVH